MWQGRELDRSFSIENAFPATSLIGSGEAFSRRNARASALIRGTGFYGCGRFELFWRS